MYAYILLFVAIISEVTGSSLMKATQGFKKLWPSLGLVVAYCLSFYALSLSLNTLPLGLAYAMWAGVGTALTALVGVVVYKEKVNKKMLLGLVCIIGGVIILNISNSGAH